MPAVNKIQGSRFLSFQTSIVCPTLNNWISTAEIKTLCFIFVSSDIFTSVNSINGDLQRSTEQMEPQLRQSKQMKMAHGPQRLYTSRASRCAFHRHSGNPDCILPSLINMRSGMSYEVGGTGSYLFYKWRSQRRDRRPAHSFDNSASMFTVNMSLGRWSCSKPASVFTPLGPTERYFCRIQVDKKLPVILFSHRL